MLILRDSIKDPKMDFLNNSMNSLLDNFSSIKWIYNDINDIISKMEALEGKINNQKDSKSVDKECMNMRSLIDMISFYRMEAKVMELDNKVVNTEST